MANKKSYYVARNEKSVENEIKEYIKQRGGLCYKIHGGDLYQETGIPDLLCCWGGLFFGIEVKDPNGKPSAIQLVQGARIKNAGGHFIIAKSVEDVQNYVERKGLTRTMSMYDKSYCSTKCIRKNCERNLLYHKPCTRIYSVSDLGSAILLKEEDTKHLKCPYFIPDYPEKEREDD